MSSLAEFIPMELVNHILSFRPRHPVAELIKKYKERLIEPFSSSLRNFYNTLTFKDLDDPSTFGLDRIFSREIVTNCIYKIKTKKYKNSEWVYWGKYYTLKQADKEFEKAKKHFCDDTYRIELVNIYNVSLREYTEEYYIYYYSESDNESDDDDEEDEILPHCFICFNMNMNLNVNCFNCDKIYCKSHSYCILGDDDMPYCSKECFINC